MLNEVCTNELALENHENAFKIARMLIEDGYVVMLSREGNLIIINYEWSARDSNRNDVVFMRREDFDQLMSIVAE